MKFSYAIVKLVMQRLFPDKLIGTVKDCLIKNKETLAVAESVTAGLLQVAFASAENASEFFQGGITVYNLGQKTKHLSVEPIHAIACDCVSAKVSREMALNVCRLFNSDWGIGITGYATPVPQSENKLFCFFTIVRQNEVIIEKKVTATTAQPFAIQLMYTDTVLKSLAEQLR